MRIKNFIEKFIPLRVLGWYHFLLAFLGAVIYRFPSRNLKVIGVTGTKGKSTVVELASKILEQAGYKVASVSSLKFKIGNKEWPNTLKMTMPGRLKLQRFLRGAVGAGCQYAVLEVTSEGILQHRHRFIDFDVAVFTNLSPEHIERHGSFEKYREAKGKLFQSLNFQFSNKKVSIVNLDDPNAEYFLQFPANKKYGFKIMRSHQNEVRNLELITARDCQEKREGISFKVKDVEFNLNLFGKFNISNALAAISLALSQGIDLETCKRALERVKGIPGRMEIVISQPFRVIVDYAHTPSSLIEVYETLRNPKFQAPNSKQILNHKFQKSKMICVLGAAGGGRDKWKRPEMGKIAAKYCDEIIITNEDPYSENPQKILEDIESGFSQIPNPKSQIPKYEKILDRREAIKKALSLAKPNDIIIITGKGSEPWMCVAGGKKIPWDDRKIVREEFEKLKIPC